MYIISSTFRANRESIYKIAQLKADLHCIGKLLKSTPNIVSHSTCNMMINLHILNDLTVRIMFFIDDREWTFNISDIGISKFPLFQAASATLDCEGKTQLKEDKRFEANLSGSKLVFNWVDRGVLRGDLPPIPVEQSVECLGKWEWAFLYSSQPSWF
jgi:hypothetical protein